MLSPGIGGRSRKAPYKTIHYRVPVVVKPIIQKLVRRYRELVQVSLQDSQKEFLVTSFLDNLDSFASNEKKLAEVRGILIEALKIRGNLGGEIKNTIRQAIKKLDE